MLTQQVLVGQQVLQEVFFTAEHAAFIAMPQLSDVWLRQHVSKSVVFPVHKLDSGACCVLVTEHIRNGVICCFRYDWSTLLELSAEWPELHKERCGKRHAGREGPLADEADWPTRSRLTRDSQPVGTRSPEQES
jgi:hypothetical protein